MATFKSEKPVETQNSFAKVSSAAAQVLGAEMTTQVERYYLPGVSTIKEPAIITFQLAQVLPETKSGFVNRMVCGLGDLALRMGVGSADIAHHRGYQGMSLKEKTQHKIDLMGLDNL